MGNQMAKALVGAGLAEELPIPKKRKNKKFTCNKCGTPMVNEDWNNFMVCPKCQCNYFIFDKQ